MGIWNSFNMPELPVVGPFVPSCGVLLWGAAAGRSGVTAMVAA